MINSKDFAQILPHNLIKFFQKVIESFYTARKIVQKFLQTFASQMLFSLELT